VIGLVKAMGNADVQVWTEDDGFVRLGVAPHGRNRYEVVLHEDDAKRLADLLAAAVGSP
jgi:hypothetical protein